MAGEKAEPNHFEVMEKYGGLSQKIYQLTENELDIAIAYIERLIASRPKSWPVFSK